MAEKITNQLDNLETTDQLRRELVANVSHDLRTPLATLQGYIETLLIKDMQLDAEQRQQYLQIAIKHCSRLNKLVEELFELAKLDAQEIRPDKELFNLAELIQDIVQKFVLKANDKKITIETITATPSTFVFADIGLIERVIENLLENALRHTPEAGSIDITLQTQTAGKCVQVQVRDSGCGIPEQEIPYIFDRFYQLDKTRNQQDGCSGLGLAIVKRIIELHQSVIKVSSDGNGYTVFRFSLPMPVA
jgi:signal transduction histidine kinase